MTKKIIYDIVFSAGFVVNLVVANQSGAWVGSLVVGLMLIVLYVIGRKDMED